MQDGIRIISEEVNVEFVYRDHYARKLECVNYFLERVEDRIWVSSNEEFE